MSAFLRQAEEILGVAMAGGADLQNAAIVIDRQGGLRMLDPSGWTLPALSAEFGAASVFRIERRAGAVRVEGLAGSERCLLERGVPGRTPGWPRTMQPAVRLLPAC